MQTVNENVHFRLIQTPCCKALQCHVNHRLPTYCSECGKLIHLELLHGDCVLVEDRDAWLKYHVADNAQVRVIAVQQRTFQIRPPTKEKEETK